MNGTDEYGGIALDDFGGIPLDDEERDEFGGIPLPFEEEQKPSFPSLGSSSTLADVLSQPTPQLTPWEGGVVRSALPGSLQPEDLLPAVRKIGGEIITGEQGQTHPDIIKDYDIPAVEIDQRGFQGPFGFMDRESATQALQSLTEFEPGRLHSTDLANAQEEAAIKEQFPSLQISPYEKAEIAAGRKVETGMESGTDFLTALGEEAKRSVDYLTPAAQEVADAARQIAYGDKLAGIQALGKPVARTLSQAGRSIWGILQDITTGPVYNPQTGKYETAVLPYSLVAPEQYEPPAVSTGASIPQERDWESLSAASPNLMAVPKVVKGTVESIPTMVAQASLGPVAGPAVWGVSEEGFDPITAATMYALPYARTYGGAIAENVASKLGISKDAAQTLINRGAGAATAAGVITADQLRKLSEMPSEERSKAAPEMIGSGIAMFLMSLPGERTKLQSQRTREFRQKLDAWSRANPTFGDILKQPEGAVPQTPDISPRVETRPEELSFKGIETEPGKVVTEADVSKMSKSEQSTLNHNRGIEYGVGLTDADVPRLEQGYKEAGKEMVKASLSKDHEGMKAAFGRLNFYGGALQGATRGTHTAAAGNYQRWIQERALSGKQAEGFTYKGKPMSESDMRVRLNQTHGVTEDSPVVFTDQGPLMNTIWEGRRNPDGSLAPSRPVRIEINRNEIYSQGQLDHFFNEELLHWYDIENKGRLDQVISALTPQESKALDTLIDKIKKYPKVEQPWEKRAQGANQLAANWRKKSFFQKMVVEIQSFLSDTLGFKASEKVLRARAEKMAAQAIINAAERVRGVRVAERPTTGGLRAVEGEPPKPAEAMPERFRLKLEPDRIDGVIEGEHGNLVVRAPTRMISENRHVVDSLTVFVERGILENTLGGTPVQHVTLSKNFTGKTPQEARNKAYQAFTDQINKEGFGKPLPKPIAQLPAPAAEPIGMGGARAGEPAPGTQIEQLTQSLRKVRESKLPLREQIKESFNVGERLATAKDAIGKALTGLKSAGDTIINQWRGVEKIDDVLRAKGDLSQAIEERGWRLRQWEKAAFKAIPNPRDQAAIAKWVDAGGDRNVLQQGLDNAPQKFKRAYQDALNLSGDKLVAAQNVQNFFESRLQEAIDAGVLEHGIENYIHRIYESRPDLQQKALAYTQTGLLKTNPSLAKRRAFQFDWEAEKEGYSPVQSFIRRITAYEAALSKAIAAREFIKKVSELEAPDGRPIVDIKGVGIPIMDPAGVYKEATLVKPKFNPSKNSEEFLPNGDKNPNYRGDYASRDYRALQRWKWVGSDSGGKPIFVQGDVGIHPDFVTRVDALLKPSQVRYGPLGKIGRPLLNVGSAVKQTMLDLSGFHPVQVTVHGMEHKVMPWNIIKDINLESPDIQGLLHGGMTLGGEYHGSYREGLVGSSLTRHIPGLGPLMESYHQWLFQDYIPRLKATMAMGALKRNRARFGGTMSEEAIFQKTANQANAAFGELNYIMLERSKTAQDMIRLILLAPDFLEARGRFALQAFEKGGKTKVPLFGNEQRAALLLGALTMFVTARIANKILDDQYHFEPENLFNIVYKDHAYGLRTVQGDILHFLNDPLKFWMSRLNPVYGRTLLEGLTGRDYFGRKRSIAEQAWDAASTVIPITLRSNRERQLWESLLNGFGATARRWSEVDSAFKLAKDWKDKNGIPERGEFIYDPNKDPLRALKLALNHGDEAGAAQEIKKVIASKLYTQKRLDQYFKRYASMPFAGSKANDLKFMRSLNADQRKTVEDARQHKFEIFKLYRKSRSQMSAPSEPSETTADEFGGIPLE